MPPSDVQRIGNPRRIVRAHIQQHRQTLHRMDTRQRRIQRQLANRDPHAARALVAQPQNPLAIRHHDAAHAVISRMLQDRLHPRAIRIAQKHSPRPPPDLREALASLAHRRRIHHRQHLLDVARDQRIEQRLVHILQIAHERIARKIIRQRPKRPQPPLHLFVQRAHMRRQQPMQRELIALRLRKRRALVEHRRVQQPQPHQRSLDKLRRLARSCHPSILMNPALTESGV